MLLTMILTSCSFFNDGNYDLTLNDPNVTVRSISLSSTTNKIKVGEIMYVSYTYKVETAMAAQLAEGTKPEWKYDTEIINIAERENGIVVKGIKEGETELTAVLMGKSATIIISVQGISAIAEKNEEVDYTIDPYIYSNVSTLTLTPGQVVPIAVSLYNGDASDVDGYNWSVDNTDVVNIIGIGQYCNVGALTEGYARIKVTHSKAEYPYYIGVYVFKDALYSTFITTKQNIITLNKGDPDVTATVDVYNPSSLNYKQTFDWKILPNEGTPDCIDIIQNAEKCVITPKKSGYAILRITNTQAGCAYPLDITVRVIEIVKNAYIQPSKTIITISGTNNETITSTIVGLNEGSDYSVDDFTYEFDDSSLITESHNGNSITISGLHNGSTLMYIGHPCCSRKRQVLLIIEGQTIDAVDASCYLTTEQNFIKTKIGAETTPLTITIVGGNISYLSNCTWSITNIAADGSSNDVIELVTSNGNVTSFSPNQASIFNPVTAQVDGVAVSAQAYIHPKNVGTATITITNPKCYYPLEILVKVLDSSANLTTPCYFTGDGIIRFLNSEISNYTVNLINATETEKSSIQWSCNDSRITVLGNGTQAQLSSTGSGTIVTQLYAKHPKAEIDKKVLVITADTQEALDNVCAFYGDKTAYSVNVEDTVNVYTSFVGFKDSDGNTLDFTNPNISKMVVWTSSKPEVATVAKDSLNPLVGNVTGIKSGSTTITIYYDGISTQFSITVYPKGYEIGKVETSKYLTTSDNVIIIPTIGNSVTTTVYGYGFSDLEKQSIVWTSQDDTIVSVVCNGTRATITAIKEGETKIIVSHPYSENSLTMYVKVGSEYIIATTPTVYISTNTDVINIKKDSSNYHLVATLINVDSTLQHKGFSFTSDNTSIAIIENSFDDGNAFIKGLNAGQCEISISNPNCSFFKKVLVVIANSDEELSAFKYLTTSSNVITIAEGKTKNVTVGVENSSEIIIEGYNWTSSNYSVLGVQSTTSSTALLTGNGIGTAILTVTNNTCSYPLEIIVQVVNSTSASLYPYIQVSNPVLTLTVSDSWTNINAELIGGNDSDQKNFSWSVSDSSIIECLGQNGIGKVKAISNGTAFVTISHPKAQYPQQILCICETVAESDCSISLSCPNIISLKPNSSDYTITASLSGGTTNDKNNFKFQLDVYDVVDLIYSDNTAMISPLKEGSVTLTVSHPKSPYSKSVIIKVQQYTNFAFSGNSMSLYKGKSTFVQMQVPSSNVLTHVEYITDNANIVTISGTSSVCQLTGVNEGTTTVRANLVETTTNQIQSSSEMLVYVQQTDVDTDYITSSNTLYVVSPNASKTFSATLTGSDVIPSDQYNLHWKSSNTDVLYLAGADTTGTVVGSSVYGTARNPGECTITISHDKSVTNLVFKIIVPENADASVTISKSYIELDVGKGLNLSSTINGGSSSQNAADYKNIIWTADKVNGRAILELSASETASGKEVYVYATKPGTTTIYATHPNGNRAECRVKINAINALTFPSGSTVSLTPGDIKTVLYQIVPTDANLNRIIAQSDAETYVEINDKGIVDEENGYGELEIKAKTAPDDGSTAHAVYNFITSGAASAQLTCNVCWNYSFTFDSLPNSTTFYLDNGVASATKTYTYKVNPKFMNVYVEADNPSIATISTLHNSSEGTGTVTITPTGNKEGAANFHIYAKNPRNNYTLKTKFDPTYTFKYNSVSLITRGWNRDGRFSDVQGTSGVRAVHLGDGETVSITLGCNVAEIEADLDWSMASSDCGISDVQSYLSGNVLYIKSNTDITDSKYRVQDATPYFDGNVVDKTVNVITVGTDYVVTIGGKHYKKITSSPGSLTAIPNVTSKWRFDYGNEYYLSKDAVEGDRWWYEDKDLKLFHAKGIWEWQHCNWESPTSDTTEIGSETGSSYITVKAKRSDGSTSNISFKVILHKRACSK